PISAPLPHISGHVVQSKRGYPEPVVHRSHRQSVRLVSITPTVSTVAQPVRSGRLVAPGKPAILCPPGRVFPLGLRRQEASQRFPAPVPITLPLSAVGPQ